MPFAEVATASRVTQLSEATPADCFPDSSCICPRRHELCLFGPAVEHTLFIVLGPVGMTLAQHHVLLKTSGETDRPCQLLSRIRSCLAPSEIYECMAAMYELQLGPRAALGSSVFGKFRGAPTGKRRSSRSTFHQT